MMTTEVKDLNQYFDQWKLSPYYMGEDMTGYWIIATMTRDSRCLEISNYECIKRYLDEKGIDYLDAEFGHWACGWYNQILIDPETAKKHLEDIWEIGDRLYSYPVFDEDHWSDLEYETIQEYWKSLSVETRMEIIQDYGGNIFEARHDYCYGDTYDYMRDSDW